jgi:D-arabinose 1-dehydrogenase-like Zn-dependent alcohol dehydrogenase
MHDEMMTFAAQHDVEPLVQVTKMNGAETIETIFKDLMANKVRYRAVLEY